jgi:ring-1,2-phenylacetyl-CoA epoxidase subunit PaaD
VKEITTENILNLLKGIPDPEIPVINIVELGVIRDVSVSSGHVTVGITPTYSGCPAMKVIEQDIISTLHAAGIDPEIKMLYSPAWTTDWMNDDAKEKLRVYGIAPPIAKSKTITCPRCNSTHTEMISQFGSTACKALYRCKDCKEPFDYFKCH